MIGQPTAFKKNFQRLFINWLQARSEWSWTCATAAIDKLLPDKSYIHIMTTNNRAGATVSCYSITKDNCIMSLWLQNVSVLPGRFHHLSVLDMCIPSCQCAPYLKSSREAELTKSVTFFHGWNISAVLLLPGRLMVSVCPKYISLQEHLVFIRHLKAAVMPLKAVWRVAGRSLQSFHESYFTLS